jgi:hypothetical protein
LEHFKFELLKLSLISLKKVSHKFFLRWPAAEAQLAKLLPNVKKFVDSNPVTEIEMVEMVLISCNDFD